MKKILLSIIIAILCLSVCLGAKSMSGDRVAIVKPVDDNLAATGSQVSVFANIQGDLLCAGGRVIVDSIVDQDVICAAGDISIADEIGGDVRIAGGNVVISAKIAGDLVVAGGNVLVKEDTTVGKDVSIIGGQVEFLGNAARNINIKAGNVLFAGESGKNVFIEAGSIEFQEGSVISGNLTYTSSAEVDLTPAEISGGVYRKVAPVRTKSQAFKSYIMRKAFAYFGLLLIGIIILLITPAFAARVGDNFGKRFWRSLGWGAIAVFAAPIAMLALLFTIIGIPLAVAGLLVYVVLLYLSKLAAACWLASKARGKAMRIAVFILALLLVYTIVSIPFIGWIVHLVLVISGAGAILTAFVKEKKARRQYSA